MTLHNINNDADGADKNRYLIMQHWLKFESEFAEGSDGTQELCDMLYASASRECPECHSKSAIRLKDVRYVRCTDCHHRFSLTAETFFGNTRRPKAYLGAIRLVKCGIEFSAHMLAKLADVAYATAWEILKKIDIILKKTLDAKAALLPSKLFEQVFRKRSRLTPAREHPVYEQIVAERELRDTRTLNISSCSEDEQQILRIMDDKVVSMEYICENATMLTGDVSSRLVMLELKGWIQRLGPDAFMRTSPNSRYTQPDGDTKELIKEIIEYLQTCTRGISRKYLHFYLARIWSLRERKMWANGALLNRCLLASNCQFIFLETVNAPLLVPFATAVDD